MKQVPDKSAMHLSERLVVEVYGGPPKYRCSCGLNHRCDWEGWASEEDESR